MTKKEEENKEVVKPEPNYEGLWIITPFEENDYWFLKTGYRAYLLIGYLMHEDIINYY